VLGFNLLRLEKPSGLTQSVQAKRSTSDGPRGSGGPSPGELGPTSPRQAVLPPRY
jgi:hypothetical protein